MFSYISWKAAGELVMGLSDRIQERFEFLINQYFLVDECPNYHMGVFKKSSTFI